MFTCSNWVHTPICKQSLTSDTEICFLRFCVVCVCVCVCLCCRESAKIWLHPFPGKISVYGDPPPKLSPDHKPHKTKPFIPTNNQLSHVIVNCLAIRFSYLIVLLDRRKIAILYLWRTSMVNFICKIVF